MLMYEFRVEAFISSSTIGFVSSLLHVRRTLLGALHFMITSLLRRKLHSDINFFHGDGGNLHFDMLAHWKNEIIFLHLQYTPKGTNVLSDWFCSSHFIDAASSRSL